MVPEEWSLALNSYIQSWNRVNKFPQGNLISYGLHNLSPVPVLMTYLFLHFVEINSRKIKLVLLENTQLN